MVQPTFSSLELKIPPALAGLLVATLMWVVSSVQPVGGFILPAKGVFAAGLFTVGVIACVLGIAEFRRAGTTVNPMTPQKSSSLVVSGIYRVTRNPMYLGFLFCLAGWAIFLSNALAFIFLPAFVLYLNRFQIRPEERALASLYGEHFSAYQAKVRRWL